MKPVIDFRRRIGKFVRTFFCLKNELWNRHLVQAGMVDQRRLTNQTSNIELYLARDGSSGGF
jgi:hypothetical protein